MTSRGFDGHTHQPDPTMKARFCSLVLLCCSILYALGGEPWAWGPLVSEVPPPLPDEWGHNGIDGFIYRGLQQHGLQPSPSTDRANLIRRVYLAVHGMPPSVAELDRFVSDYSPDAYQRLLDRVLTSPRVGERWAQHWLDVIRFAETWGFETNSFRDQAYHYRNWLIEALNDDISFDRFVMAQMAGDVIGVDAATGFLVAGPANLPGQIGKDIESQRQARQDELDEVVRTVSEGFWGLTVGCARCHDHKFDPIPQRDYYALQAVFSGLRYGHRRLRGDENRRWAQRIPAAELAVEQAKEQRLTLQKQWRLAPSINPAQQEHRFAALDLKALRMKIKATANGGAASLHELEVWSATDSEQNVALASLGGVASASSYTLNANQSRHPDNLIDGKATFPWVADLAGEAWVQVTFSGVKRINRIVWRQGGGSFPVDYEIEGQSENGEWRSLGNVSGRMPHLEDRRQADKVMLSGVSEEGVSEILRANASLNRNLAERRRLAAGPQVFAGFFQTPDETFRLHRGDPMRRREPVAPNAPTLFDSLRLESSASDETRRLALARAITDRNNPLAWRVMVNRVWQHYFGNGLVKTPSDFGYQGADASHPELLDWLVRRWQESGGRFKSLHRLILSSAVFRQDSRSQEAGMASDADSVWLWRFPPRLLEAEALRDGILAVSGELNLEMYGEGFNFFHNRGGLADYRPKTSFGAAELRRMIYSTKLRMTTVDTFGAFNCPDAGQMTALRSQSITPIQALNLFNGPFIADQANVFAERIVSLVGSKAEPLEGQVRLAARIALARELSDAQLSVLLPLARSHGLAAVCRVLFNSNEFVLLH